jgi:ATP-binding protein involved in chromosome partitioning
MATSEQHLREALRRIAFPGFERDIVTLGVVRRVALEGTTARVELEVPAPASDVAPALERAVRAALLAVPGVERVELRHAGGGAPALKVVTPQRESAAAGGGLDGRLIPRVSRVVAVASGKGGVGKSTVAVNLAVALGRAGARTGLLDADIYGPSIPLMTGLQHERPRLERSTGRIVPFERYGIRLMSLGFFVEPDSAVIWRGPMVMKAIDQLLRDVEWGELDVLVVDMPPGTGDAQLTLSQRVRLAGAVIVTTPQDVALADAIKGVAMFRKVGVDVLGIVENMSFFACPHCGERSDVFGHGGGRSEADRLGVPFLGEVPLESAIRASGDAGRPVTADDATTPVARAFEEIAGTLAARLGLSRTELTDPPGPSGDEGLFGRFRRVFGGGSDAG